METAVPAYGLWWLVIVNSVIFILFAFTFYKPDTPRDWRSFGAFSAFLVALFTEMYGFPLTIYLLSGWLGTRYPGVDWMSHDGGHLLEQVFGWGNNPHFGPFHILKFLVIGGGFVLISAARRVLYDARRPPQYVGFILVMFWVFAAVADAAVPGFGRHVCAAGARRRVRSTDRVWAALCHLYARCTGLCATLVVTVGTGTAINGFRRP